jgi:hypothetical protein
MANLRQAENREHLPDRPVQLDICEKQITSFQACLERSCDRRDKGNRSRCAQPFALCLALSLLALALGTRGSDLCLLLVSCGKPEVKLLFLLV